MSPHLAKGELYRISGHLPYYKEDLYAPLDIEGDEYYLKPMNCPHHHMIYKARPHSLDVCRSAQGTIEIPEARPPSHGSPGGEVALMFPMR